MQVSKAISRHLHLWIPSLVLFYYYYSLDDRWQRMTNASNFSGLHVSLTVLKKYALDCALGERSVTLNTGRCNNNYRLFVKEMQTRIYPEDNHDSACLLMVPNDWHLWHHVKGKSQDTCWCFTKLYKKEALAVSQWNWSLQLIPQSNTNNTLDRKEAFLLAQKQPKLHRISHSDCTSTEVLLRFPSLSSHLSLHKTPLLKLPNH